MINENDRNDILETKLLPAAGKKQKEFEDYLDQVEVFRRLKKIKYLAI